MIKRFYNKYNIGYKNLLISIFSPILGLIISFKNIIKQKGGFFPYAIIAFFLACVAYQTIPTPDYDLYRHYNIINIFIENNIQITDGIFGFGYPFTVTHTLFTWLIAQTNNVHLYSFVLVFVTYLAIFYILKAFNNKQLSSYQKILLILYAITVSFYRIFVFSIRNIFVFVISFLTVLLFKENKIKKCHLIIIAILLFFFHPVSILVFLFYFLDKIIKSKKVKIVIACLILFSEQIFRLFYSLIPKTNFYIANKIHMYLYKENITNFNYLILYIVIFSLCVLLMFFYWRRTKKLNFFDIFLVAVYFAFIDNFDLNRRFIVLIGLISFKYIIFALTKMKKQYVYIVYTVIFSIIIASLFGDYAGIREYGWILQNNGLNLLFNTFGLSICLFIWFINDIYKLNLKKENKLNE